MVLPEPITHVLLAAQFWPSFGFERLMTAVGLWRRWDWIDPHVALGALPTRGEVVRLHGEGVTAFVNLCAEYRGRTGVLQELGIEQLHLPTLDYHSPSAADLKRGAEFVLRCVDQGRKVFMHCKAGQGRSATLALVYLAARGGLSPSEAFAQVRRVRRQITHGIDRRPAVREALESLAARFGGRPVESPVRACLLR